MAERTHILKTHLGPLIKKMEGQHQDVSMVIEKKDVLTVFQKLRDDKDLAYTQLIDLCVVDYLGQESKRFQGVYHVLSMDYNHRLRVTVALDEDEHLPSLTKLFSSAGWWEREAFDMFGVVFEGHPDLRRILSDYDFDGFPLRKDFPLTGYVQVRYDEEEGAVVKEPVHLAQAFRTFETLSPWEGMGSAFQRLSLDKEKQP